MASRISLLQLSWQLTHRLRVHLALHAVTVVHVAVVTVTVVLAGITTRSNSPNRKIDYIYAGSLKEPAFFETILI